MNRMRRPYLSLAAIVVCVMILLGNEAISAQEEDQPKSPKNASQQSPFPVEQENPERYPKDEWPVGTPIDVEQDLDTSSPQRDSVLGPLVPQDWYKWKEDLYVKYGLKLGIGYQMLYQKASDSLTDTDTAWGQWALLEGKWELLNRGQDFEGSLAFTLDWRDTIGNNAQAFNFSLDTGSLWPTDFIHLDWGPWFPVFYWEQWFAKDVFVLRLGGQISSHTYDFFRFKDGRTSFTASPYTNAVASIPTGPPGLAASFKWRPNKDSELYVSGTINDMNAVGGEFTWDNAFKYGQFFYGLEVGQFWRRGEDDFDHAHLNLFYADERDTEASVPILPSKAGWGFKLLGEKQFGRIVGFGSYTYNTAEGGGFGTTVTRHAVTAGVAFLYPLSIQGELGLGTIWAQPIPDELKNQYGLNTYWKLLLTPNFWITPGVQLIFDPSFNPETDLLTIGQIKFRLVF